jgi:DNA-binding transcriptional LysR family regulator
MQNDQLNGLVALKIVAEKRSFTLAAEALSVTPSAISQIIKQLEARVGVALLSRTTRSISLTEAGEQFLNQTGPALDQIFHAFDEVGDYAKKPSGLLRINLPKLVFHSFLSPIIKSFSEKYPEVTVELFFEDAKSDVVGNGFDAGIRLSDILAKDMVAFKLYGPVSFVTASSPAYFNKMGRPKHPKDLLAHKCIPIRLGAGLYDRWEFEHKGEEFEVQVKGPMILNDSLAMIDVAIDGQGIIYTSEDAIKDEVESGKLEIVLDKFKSTSAGYYLYYPKRAQVLPKLRAFIDHIKTR